MRVVITEPASADLEEIFDYIATDSSLAAIKYVRALRKKARSLGNFPKKYALRRDLPGELRAAPHQSHLIFYRIVGQKVEVVRFVHGARDLTPLLEK